MTNTNIYQIIKNSNEFSAELITDKVCTIFNKLLVDFISAQNCYNRKCLNYRDQRSLCALLFGETKLWETSGQLNLTEADEYFKEIKVVYIFCARISLALVVKNSPLRDSLHLIQRCERNLWCPNLATSLNKLSDNFFI